MDGPELTSEGLGGTLACPIRLSHKELSLGTGSFLLMLTGLSTPVRWGQD